MWVTWMSMADGLGFLQYDPLAYKWAENWCSSLIAEGNAREMLTWLENNKPDHYELYAKGIKDLEKLH